MESDWIHPTGRVPQSSSDFQSLAATSLAKSIDPLR